MQENDEKRIERTVVWLDAKLVPRMDGWLAADNCKNRSEFINKALRFYMGYLGTSARRTTPPTSPKPSSQPFRVRWTTTTIGSAAFFSSARWN